MQLSLIEGCQNRGLTLLNENKAPQNIFQLGMQLINIIYIFGLMCILKYVACQILSSLYLILIVTVAFLENKCLCNNCLEATYNYKTR